MKPAAAVLRSMAGRYPEHALFGFQKRFIRSVLKPSTRVAVFSAGRGNAKSALAARFAVEVLDGGFGEGGDVLVVSASVKQASLMFDDALRYLSLDRFDQRSVKHRFRVLRGQGDMRIEDRANRTG